MASSSQSANLDDECPDVTWYNQSFYSNACHVCKNRLFRSSEVICNTCYMIYYCCPEHALEDRPNHHSFCNAIEDIFAQVKFRQRFHAPILNRVDWINSRNALINLIEQRLARPLYLHEKQMIIFVRSCLVCRTQKNLVPCETCYCVNYCLEHVIEGSEIHHSKCSDLQDCFNFDIQRTRPIFKMKLTQVFNKGKPLENMDKFVKQYVTSCAERLLKISYTDYLSCPLTLCYWIQEFDLLELESMADPNFVVHIIDADILDRAYIEAWHLLLHYLPGVYNLRVELIGSVTNYENSPLLVCSSCDRKRKKLTYGCYCESYHQYVSSKNYKEPNVIMGSISNLTPWNTETVTALKGNIQCPIIITGPSKDKLNKYIIYINSPEEVAFGYTLDEAVKNPFHSYRLHRKIDSDGVLYRNEFVIVFKNPKD